LTWLVDQSTELIKLIYKVKTKSN